MCVGSDTVLVVTARCWRVGFDKPADVSTFVWGVWWRYLTDFPASQNLAQGHFKVGSHTQIENHVRSDQKMLGPVTYYPLWYLRYQAMNSALQFRYFLGERPPETKQIWRNAPYHPLGCAREDNILCSSQHVPVNQQISLMKYKLKILLLYWII